MERDLSLIEISGEDDSLLSLQQSPIVSNDSPYFSCSPLLRIPRSPPSFNPTPRPAFSTEIIEDEKDTSKPTSSSSEDINQGNDNANKLEAPKLNVDPQKLKRKKGRGFNLRKSLAWDRAFFTEEGVLDPVELSLLSGNTLSVIHEGRESLSSDLDGPSVSPGLKAIEHNLFKDLPSSARNQGSKVASKTSPKLAYSAKKKMHPASSQNIRGMKFTMMSKTSPQAKRKVLSAQDINRSASKRNGCPRPVASSSLKRASNTNVINMATKEPRVSKQLATKNEPLAASTTSRSSATSSSHPNINFTSQPATGQTNVRIKGISTNARSCRNDAKSGPVAKVIKKSTAQTGRSMLKVAAQLEMQSSTDLQLPQVSLANNSLGGLSDAAVPVAAHPLNGHDSTCRKNAVSLPQTTCYYGGNMQHVQTQIAKPSGLRMPSPSLGFFCQSEIQRSPQPCNPPQASIPTVSKAGALNSIQKRPPRPLRMIPSSSGTVQSVTCTSTNSASCGIIKSESELSDTQKVALLFQDNSDSSDIAKSEQQLNDAVQKPSDDAAPFEKVEKLSCIGNKGLQFNDIKLSQQSSPCEQLEKDDCKSAVDVFPRSSDLTSSGLDLLNCASPLQLIVEVEGPSETSNALSKQQVEDRKCEPSVESYSISPESDTASMNHSINENDSDVHEEQLSGLDVFELSPQQAELKKHGTLVDPISEMPSQKLIETLMEDYKSSKTDNKDCISNAADNVLEVQDCSAVCCSPANCTDTQPTKIETSGADCFDRGLHIAEDTLFVGSCKRLTNTSAVDSDWNIFNSPANSAEQTETLNSGVITEQVTQNNCERSSKGGFEHGKCSEACLEANDTFIEQLVEDREYKPFMKSYSVSPVYDKENMNNNLYWTASEVHEKQLSGLYEFEMRPQQAELKKSDTFRDAISEMESQRLNSTLVGDSRSPEKGDTGYVSNAADYVVEAQDRSAVSYGPTSSAGAEPTKGETSKTDCLNGGFNVEEVQMLSVKSSLLVGCCKNLTNTPAKDSNWMVFDSQSAKSAEQTEILESYCLTEQISQNNCKPPSVGHLQHGNFSEDSQEKNVLQSVNSASSGASDVLCSDPSVNQGCNFAATETVECLHGENAFFVDNESAVRNFRHNVEANTLALDTVCESDIIGEIITNNITEENYCQKTGGDIGSKVKNPNIISQISPSQVDVASGINNLSLHSLIDKQSDPSKKNFFFSGLERKASYSPEKETVVLRSDCSNAMRDMKEQVAQAKLIPCCNEIEQVNQNCEVHDGIFGQENGSFEDANFIDGCGFEISHIPRKMDEVAGIDNTTKEAINEDALVHFIADSYICNMDYSLENKSYVLEGDDKSGQLKRDRELQNLDLVIEEVPQENVGPCLSDNLLLINSSVESQGIDTSEDIPLESEGFVADVIVGKNVEYQSMKPSSDNVECCMHFDDNSYDELDNQTCPANFDSPSISEGYQISSVTNKESKCSLHIKTNGTSNGSIQQIAHEPYNTILPLEGESNIHQSNDIFESELRDGLHSDVHPEEVKDAKLSLLKSVEDKKQCAPKIELPPNAVPFSDEWLAVLEASGEEILARKGGAVQNSPPDKSLPEPGPWSPVKRKNNQGLGPFDCTKFTNPTDPSSTSN